MNQSLDTGLYKQDVQLLLDCIRSNPRVKEVILFGSRAKGNYRPGSDIDLALVGADITREDMDQIAIDIDDLLLPYQVDLIRTHEQTEGDLFQEISQWGVSLGDIMQALNE